MAKESAQYKRLMGKMPERDRIIANYKSRTAAERKVAQLKKQGYRARYSAIMGNYEVWVSPKYFRDHPKAKGYID